MPRVPPITLVLALALLVGTLVSFAVSRRGGRFRSLPAWMGFWGFFAPLLVLLSLAKPLVSIPLLGVLMFGALREYFFVAPLRSRDRWAILGAYLSVPLVLWLATWGSWPLFFAIAPASLFLLIPALLALPPPQSGLFEAAGRILVGTVAFVFFPAHLALMVESFDPGQLELFGILVLASELPQRLAGRMRGGDLARGAVGIATGAALASAAGVLLGPLAGLGGRDGGLAGLAVAAGTAAGALLADGMAQDLNQSGSPSRIGRAAFLDRSFPAVYAAAPFFHCVAVLTVLR